MAADDTEAAQQSPQAAQDDDDDGMVGPAPPPAKKRKVRPKVAIIGIVSIQPTQVLEFEAAYLRALPSAAMYERSYMHRDTITHVVVARAVDFIITGTPTSRLLVLIILQPHKHLSFFPAPTSLCTQAASMATSSFGRSRPRAWNSPSTFERTSDQSSVRRAVSGHIACIHHLGPFHDIVA